MCNFDRCQQWMKTGFQRRSKIAAALLAMIPLAGPTLHAQDGSRASWGAGVEAVFAQPRLSDDLALGIEDEDLGGNIRYESWSFEHDFEASPRVWIEYQSAGQIGLRAAWWQLDSTADGVTANPPASGFGELSHPDMLDVDLSSVIPADTLAAASALEMYTIDLEITKRMEFDQWDLALAAGLRHARVDQRYAYELTRGGGTPAGRMSLEKDISGLGPTLAISSSRWAFDRLMLSASLRASVLLANADRQLSATEDMDLPNTFTTDYTERQDDVLPIVETRFAGHWLAMESERGALVIDGGVEAQWWNGVGTLHNQDADLAVLGLFLGTGWIW